MRHIRIMGFCFAVVFAMSAIVAAASASPPGVAAWGDGEYGQLGNGSSTTSDVPVVVSGLSRVKQVSVGDEQSLALLSNDTVVAWGFNKRGALGNGTTTNSDVPVAVCAAGPESECPNGPYLRNVKAVSTGCEHSLALLRNGRVMAWGDGEYGQLGNGRNANSDVPVAVSDLSGVKEVSAGCFFSEALLENGTVMTWGDNEGGPAVPEAGELGNGTTTNSDVPVAVCEPGAIAPCSAGTGNVLKGVSTISTGNAQSLALLENDKVMAWGANNYGQLGDGSTINSDVPVEVSKLSGLAVTAVSGGDGHSLALLENGKVMAWGRNLYGELGDGTTTGPETCGLEPCSKTPVEVNELSGVKAVSAGGDISLALLRKHRVMAWGLNGEYGQLGNGTTIESSDLPVAVCEVGATAPCSAGKKNVLKGVSAISAGVLTGLALTR